QNTAQDTPTRSTITSTVSADQATEHAALTRPSTARAVTFTLSQAPAEEDWCSSTAGASIAGADIKQPPHWSAEPSGHPKPDPSRPSSGSSRPDTRLAHPPSWTRRSPCP